MDIIQVKKASGQLEPFSEEKVILSLKRASVDQNLTKTILTQLKNELYDGIPTNKIYSGIFESLKKENPLLLGKFNLKRAIMELGPTGYPFEKFIGALLKHNGYTIEVGANVFGKCVNHEVDVVAEKDNQHFMVECKFHNQPGGYSDVKVTLYVKARFDDIAAVWREKVGHQTKFHQAWLVTNTKLTSDAIQYGECAGMKLIGWNYPNKGSLRDLIEDSGLHPITCLSSLSATQKQILLSHDIVLCKDLLNIRSNILTYLNLPVSQMEKLKDEVEQLCRSSQMQKVSIV
ncbi:ATPase [Candidatus Daviesbacteria bacterium RIFCSPHIGHO2_01_FULL_40_24]|uniref:ATP-cone domain protein n=1 Tax=Candidatus Daviesbacteria bacterium GW2011_GWC2_40_12 TaxID=1618431 RepID=A0A0G0TXQ5_9BACT|nr:MAG: ATP-cone domain protein [Candidatus Daviesbacteria bacterium GW2011_GWA2_39_33]KKR42787.1 MAG: ATP-cone domain protein [Candidatus Daviesbacteria bacterium GW2011_GWC2_40_12]OGE21632.1 MAG: ATPase [Candidatus Daviesbacteria bacterium RIFCSPHIGHO2_01_FULL_40_24]OGE30029.1 MAG: ATPase [Candidatus Daviesbacteria bacterium RIFCSPHIGHO2_02_FULL_40_16]OGE43536.1 MAG: ATPase [Candidatus Daviesbacteria bacterium RIFCSPLOWO2_01_FULL_39_23]OGE67809.1 MAG: ATPase [Candidatus Daviesbacteria bacter